MNIFLPDYAEMFEYLFNGEYSGSYINSIMLRIPIEVLLPSVIEDFTNDTSHPLKGLNYLKITCGIGLLMLTCIYFMV